MNLWPRLTFALMLLACLGHPATSTAGLNANASAMLSWDQFSQITDLPQAPGAATPLFLRIANASSVQAMSVQLNWSPNDLRGPCYWVAASEANNALCGSTLSMRPTATFDGDSTHTWSIQFAEGADPTCVTFLVVGDNCDGKPASLCLMSVRLEDANGDIDDVAVTGGATILGGVEDQCPVAVSGVQPHYALAGQIETLTIRGNNLTPASSVSLINGALETPASSVAMTSSNELTVSVPIPSDFAGMVDIVVSSSAHSDTLEGELIAQNASPSYQPHQLIVWFSPGVVAFPQTKWAQTSSVSFSPSSVQGLLNSAGVDRMRKLTPRATESNLAGLDLAQLDMYVCELLDTTVVAAIATLMSDPEHVRSADPNWRMDAAMVIPNDQYFGRQWWLRNTGLYGGVAGYDLHAPQAWDITTGGSPITVHVIDSGVDATHPDLAGRIAMGYDFINDYQTIPYDDHLDSHGTAIAGMIAAAGNVGGSVAGVNWSARISALKVVTQDGFIDMDDVIAAIDEVRYLGGTIANLSLGSLYSNRTLEHVCKNAYMSGVALFAASGNLGVTANTYPAAYRKFVNGVGAIQPDGRRWDDDTINWPQVCQCSGPSYTGASNYGAYLDFVAPGGRFIQTTARVSRGSYWQVAPGPPYYYFGFGGTSAASGAATGVAALLKSHVPSLTNEDIHEVLVRTTRTVVPYQDTNFRNEVGYGRISADSALKFVPHVSVVRQGAIGTTADVGQSAVPARQVIYWPGIPAGTYSAVRHSIQGTVDLSGEFSTVKAIWPRNIASYGAGDDVQIASEISTGTTPPPWTPTVWVLSHVAGSTSATFETFVYRLSGGGQEYWWPTAPSGAHIEYTAIGTPLVTAVGPSRVERGPLRILVGANPSVGHVDFEIGGRGDATGEVRVLDVAGRTVRRIGFEQLGAESRALRWDGCNEFGEVMGAGVYFLSTGESLERVSKRVVLLR